MFYVFIILYQFQNETELQDKFQHNWNKLRHSPEQAIKKSTWVTIIIIIVINIYNMYTYINIFHHQDTWVCSKDHQHNVGEESDHTQGPMWGKVTKLIQVILIFQPSSLAPTLAESSSFLTLMFSTITWYCSIITPENDPTGEFANTVPWDRRHLHFPLFCRCLLGKVFNDD